MSSEIRDGGPAFAYGNHEQGGASGMSLRDYFAGQALAGICAGLCATPEGEHDDRSANDRMAFKQAEKDAYRIADSMLAARTETGER